MLSKLKRAWHHSQLQDPGYAFLFDPPPPGEWVSIDCRTTGFDRENDHIIQIGAVRVVGQRVLTSQKLDILVKPDTARVAMETDSVRTHQLLESDLDAHGQHPREVARQVLQFIGSRPLVGYFLAFDVAMIDRLVLPLTGIPLPNEQIDVSALYYDLKYQQNPDAPVDLRFASLMNDLELPQRDTHHPVSDATMAALAFIKLTALLGR